MGSTTKIITRLVMVPPNAMVVEFGFSIPWTPKLIASVASRVTTLWPLIQARIFSLLTKRPKPMILATLSILYTADQITPHRPTPAKKLDDAVGVNIDMVNLRLTDDGDFAPTPVTPIEGARRLEFELGLLVEQGAYRVLEGLAVGETTGTIDDASFAFGFDEADRLACLALQVPVGAWKLVATLPAAHDFAGLSILSP